MKSIFIVLMLLFCSQAVAEIYKWVDDQGKVHYSDKPVKQDAQQLNIKTEDINKSKLSQQERLERRQRLLQAYDEDRAKRKEEDSKAEKQQQRLQRECVIAKDRLAQYERSTGLYDLDKEGNRVMLSEKERESVTDRLRQQIKQHCK